MQVTDINPISALADIIGEQIASGDLSLERLGLFLDHHAVELWQHRVENLRMQTGLDGTAPQVPDMTSRDISRPVYGAVFTAHPVFALKPEVSAAMCNHAVAESGEVPDGAFAPRQSVTLDEEHSEAMTALKHGRAAVNEFNADILRQLRSADPDGWRKTLPAMVNVSTWVGYDLDGRSDINWTDSFRLRLREKHVALRAYELAVRDSSIDILLPIADRLAVAVATTSQHLKAFEAVESGEAAFDTVMNALTEHTDRLVSSQALQGNPTDCAGYS